MKILITGGSGLLSKYLIPLIKQEDGDGTLYPRVIIDSPTHTELDITRQINYAQDYDLIIHLAAYTDVVKAEKEEKEKCFMTNVIGTLNLLNAYSNIPFVYLSSEYARNPVNFYAKTKFIGEILVSKLAKKYFIIRTLFKPKPFPFDKAFVDQYTQGDEVDVIARLISNEFFNWLRDKKNRLLYIGTGRKRIIDIARKSKPDVKECSIKDIKGVALPSDYL